MPGQERIGMEDEEGSPPSPDPAGEEDEPEAVGWGERWLAALAMDEDKLLAEEGVLGNELGFAASEIEGRAKEDRIARRLGEMEASRLQGCQCGMDAVDKPVD
jgi:hypothetical protein